MPTLVGLGGGDATATDSVTVSGQMGQTNGLANFSEDDIRQRVQDAIANAQRQGGAVGDMANAVAGMLGGMMGGGPGGFGGGPGGGGGGRGGAAVVVAVAVAVDSEDSIRRSRMERCSIRVVMVR